MMRDRIAKLEHKTSDGESEMQRAQREHQIKSMKHRLAHWKVLADINDPLVKKNFEDGLGKHYFLSTVDLQTDVDDQVT